MTGLLAAVFAVCIALGVPARAEAQAAEPAGGIDLWRNLVVNGSFEQGRDYWVPSRGGVSLAFPTAAAGDGNSAEAPSERASSGGPATQSAPVDGPTLGSAPPDGARALRVEKTDQAAFSLRQTLLGPLAPGEPYTLSAWVRTDSLTGNGARLVLITERWAWEGSVPLPTGTAGWQLLSVTVTPPPSALYQVGLFLPAGVRGVVWIDGVQLERGPAATGYKESIHPVLELAATLDGLLQRVEERRGAVARGAGAPGGPVAAGFSGALAGQAERLQELRGRVGEVIAAPTTALAHERWDALQASGIRLAVDELARAVVESELAVDAASPWENAWPPGAPAELGPPPTLALQAFRGERLYASLRLGNFSGRTAYVRVNWEPFAGRPASDEWRRAWQDVRAVLGPDLVIDPEEPVRTLAARDVVRAYEVAPIPARTDGTMAADLLMPLNPAGVITVPSGESRELFFSFDTEGVPPGRYRSVLHLAPTGGAPARAVPVEIEILPLDLTAGAAGRAPRLSPWGAVYANPQAAGAPDAYLADAVDHGINVSMLSPSLVLPELNPDGTFRAPIDFSEADRRLEAFRRAAAGKKAFYVGYYSVAHVFRSHAQRFGIPYPSEAFDRAFKAWMRAWIDHLLALGLEYREFAFELRDEPDQADEFELFLHTAKLLREVDPNVQSLVTVNFRDLRMLEAARPYTDIWVALGDVLVRPEVAEFLRSTGGEVWLYHASRRGKALDPQGYYRVQGWLAHRYDLAGWGFYTWLSTSEETWALNADGNNFSAVYVTGSGPVPSRRGEAWRRGRDDYLALRLFSLVAGRAEAHGVSPGIVAAARQAVDEAVDAALRAVDYPGTYAVAAGRIDAFDEAVAVVRAQTLALVGQLRAR